MRWAIKSVVVMPQTQSKEKIEPLDLYGADLRLVQATNYNNPNHYVHQANRLAEKLNDEHDNGAIWARQFDNLANMEIHNRTTGEEIWQQTDGKVDLIYLFRGHRRHIGRRQYRA